MEDSGSMGVSLPQMLTEWSGQAPGVRLHKTSNTYYIILILFPVYTRCSVI